LIQSCEVIGVGIGQVSKSQLAQVCGQHTTFVIDNYETLMNIVPSKSQNDGTVHGSDIVFSYRQLRKPVGFKEPFPLTIQIKNSGEAHILQGSILEVECGEFFEKETKRLQVAIATETRGSVTLELEVTGNADINTLPGEISIRLLHPTSKLPYKSKTSGFQIEICKPFHLLVVGGSFDS